MRWLAAALVIATIGSAVATIQVSASAEDSSEVSGVVADVSGAVVVQAELLFNCSGAIVKTRTDQNGFAVKLRSGSCFVIAQASGFERKTITDLQIHAPQPVTLNVVLQLGTTPIVDGLFPSEIIEPMPAELPFTSIENAPEGSYSRGATTGMREILRVRPLANVWTLLYGSSLNHKWASFYLAVEEPGGKVRPIQIAYAFYHLNQLPPESFWNYSKIYEIEVQRDVGCDAKVENLAYVRNTTADGKKLPRSFALRFAKNAPKGLLKMESVAPCYILWYRDYRQVQPKDR